MADENLLNQTTLFGLTSKPITSMQVKTARSWLSAGCRHSFATVLVYPKFPGRSNYLEFNLTRQIEIQKQFTRNLQEQHTPKETHQIKVHGDLVPHPAAELRAVPTPRHKVFHV